MDAKHEVYERWNINDRRVSDYSKVGGGILAIGAGALTHFITQDPISAIEMAGLGYFGGKGIIRRTADYVMDKMTKTKLDSL